MSWSKLMKRFQQWSLETSFRWNERRRWWQWGRGRRGGGVGWVQSNNDLTMEPRNLNEKEEGGKSKATTNTENQSEGEEMRVERMHWRCHSLWKTMKRRKSWLCQEKSRSDHVTMKPESMRRDREMMEKKRMITKQTTNRERLWRRIGAVWTNTLRSWWEEKDNQARGTTTTATTTTTHSHKHRERESGSKAVCRKTISLCFRTEGNKKAYQRICINSRESNIILIVSCWAINIHGIIIAWRGWRWWWTTGGRDNKFIIQSQKRTLDLLQFHWSWKKRMSTMFPQCVLHASCEMSK